MREPVTSWLDPGPRRDPSELLPTLHRAAAGCWDDDWDPPLPSWLMSHQISAARRIAGALRVFRGALLADDVGLGKSYVALAIAGRYRGACVIPPAALVPQWRRLSARLGVPVTVVSHESLGRGHPVPEASLIIVDEAHRFRNPNTKRYDRLARGIRRANVLLVTATPVVNRGADLVQLLRLFLPDHGVAPLGVPSLERALAAGEHTRLMHAVAPIVVARSNRAARPATSLPTPVDSTVITAAPLESRALGPLIEALDALRFPSFGTDAAALLRHHIFYRLGSSAAACRETLLRHSTYVRRAIAAANRGEELPRRAARALFGNEFGPQLDLLLGRSDCVRVRTEHLEAEHAALTRAAATIDQPCDAPKERELIRILESRRRRKTIVFTTATTTALGLARLLGWTGVAVVSGRGARIASGTVPIHEAFDLFAPRARGCARPGRALPLHVLIATDLASEGLDLQDADALVHFDLPWTPLRLQQRLGRIARLGSTFQTVDVWWFAPPPEIDARLRLAERIDTKLATQLSLAVTSSSRIGRARVCGGFLEARELAAAAPHGGSHGFAVVDRPVQTICALRWNTPGGVVRQLGMADGTGVFPSLILLGGAVPLHAPLPDGCLSDIHRLVATRIAHATAGPSHQAGKTLIRQILARARHAAHNRLPRLLALLDRVLDRVHGGIDIGAERELTIALASERPVRALQLWLGRTPEREGDWNGPWLEALVVGT